MSVPGCVGGECVWEECVWEKGVLEESVCGRRWEKRECGRRGSWGMTSGPQARLRSSTSKAPARRSSCATATFRTTWSPRVQH
eukprot:2851549-Rhodomonas_salina.1